MSKEDTSLRACFVGDDGVCAGGNVNGTSDAEGIVYKDASVQLEIM